MSGIATWSPATQAAAPFCQSAHSGEIPIDRQCLKYSIRIHQDLLVSRSHWHLLGVPTFAAQQTLADQVYDNRDRNMPSSEQQTPTVFLSFAENLKHQGLPTQRQLGMLHEVMTPAAHLVE